MADTLKLPWVLLVRFRIKPGMEEEFIAKVSVPIDAMRHEKTFISFSMARHPTDPKRFLFYEVWESREEFLSVQQHREYRAAYMARLGDLTETPPEYEQWHEMRADPARPRRAS